MPLDPAGLSLPGPHPVIVFLYGGSWSTGDKDMYGLLCTQLADSAQAIVCCPNYSIYPKVRALLVLLWKMIFKTLS